MQAQTVLRGDEDALAIARRATSHILPAPRKSAEPRRADQPI
jgi:hypothetical protein